MNLNILKAILLMIGVISLQSSTKADSSLSETYTNINLKMQLPSWKMDIDDQTRRWNLLAYPLVENPVADVQYRIVISIIKLPLDEHLRIYPKANSNLSDWMHSQHLSASQMTNDSWVYVRKDIFGTNGFAYYCSGRVKRIPESKSQMVGGADNELAEHLEEIFNSIEILPKGVISTNVSTATH